MISYQKSKQLLQPLFDAVEKINNYPDLHKFLEVAEGSNQKWLPMCNILNEHIEAPEDFKNLLNDLSDQLHGLLIDSNGQHSDLFFCLRNFDYHSRTGERDSFGPLSSVFSPPNRPWYVCYG